MTTSGEENLKKIILQLERDLEDMRLPVIARSTEELTQDQRDSIGGLMMWAGDNARVYPFLCEQIRLLHKLYEERATQVQVLNVELAKYKNLATQEHVRADENFLDSQNYVGQNRESVRRGIYEYLRYVSEVKPGVVILYPHQQEIIGWCATWVENRLDEQWATDVANQEEARLKARDQSIRVVPEGGME